jgi:hypothetical protein
MGRRREPQRRCSSWSLGGDELGGCPPHLLGSAAIIPGLRQLGHRALRQVAALSHLPLVMGLDQHRPAQSQHGGVIGAKMRLGLPLYC